MPLVIGATAAGFSIIRQLEHEEFGELYVAEHPRLPRQQTLHLIPSEVSVDLDYRIRFNQESDQAASLWHPNIAGLTDRGEYEDQLWISTEYVDGVDAAELLGDGHLDGMPPRMVVEIVTAIADALDYAHDSGVLHRYVNPGNIIVNKSPTERRRIALTGFGVARPERAHNTLTRAGMFIGTAGYTAPEQLMGDEIDGRADQYALAASAFHLLTGAPPFAHFNPSVVVNRQLNDRPPRPSEIRPDLTEFDAIFARALSTDPVDRFRRCRDFAKALESTGGTRSHIRATSEVRAASIFREARPGETTPSEARSNGNATAAAFVGAPVAGDAAPTEALDQTLAVHTNGASANHVDPVTTTIAAPAAELIDDDDYDDYDDYDDGDYDDGGEFDTDDHDEYEDDGFDQADDDVYEDDVYEDEVYDDEVDAAQARKRRLQHSAAIAGVIAVVLVAWFMGVKALRSASRPDDAPANVENTSTEPTATAPAYIPPPAVITPMAPPVAAPPPVATTTALPTTAAPAPTATPTTTKPQAVTTTAAEPSTVAQTTTAPKPKPTTTPSGPNVLDTRPAVGMPCGPEGSAAVSNSGSPVICAETPGGSAWEPPGGG